MSGFRLLQLGNAQSLIVASVPGVHLHQFTIEAAQHSVFAGIVGGLHCLHGIQTIAITYFLLSVEMMPLTTREIRHGLKRLVTTTLGQLPQAQDGRHQLFVGKQGIVAVHLPFQ